MEVRLQPRSDGPQHCLTFELDVTPAANIMQYRDFMGNTVHHFDIAGKHSQVKVTARSSVEVQPAAPPNSADAGSWADLDRAIAAACGYRRSLGDASPQPVRQIQPRLEALAAELRCERRDTPLQLLTELNESIYELLRLRPQQHQRRLAHRRRPPLPPGRLPGFRPHHDRARPSSAHSLPLRQRIHVSPHDEDADEKKDRSWKARPTPGWKPSSPIWDGSPSTPPTT